MASLHDKSILRVAGITFTLTLCIVSSSVCELIISSVTTTISTVRQGNRNIPVEMYVTNTSSRDVWLEKCALKFMKDTNDVSSYYTVKVKSPRALIIPRNSSDVKVEFLVDVSTAAPKGATTIDGLLEGWENVVPNGSFEEGLLPEPTYDNIAPHWYHWPTTSTFRDYTIDSSVGVHGSSSYKITFKNASRDKNYSGPDQYATVNTGGVAGNTVFDFSLLLPVEPDTVYSYGMKYKDEFYYGVDRFFVIEEYDEEGRPTNPQGFAIFNYVPHSEDWNATGGRIQTRLTTKYLRVWFGLELWRGVSDVSGSCWIDEIVVKSAAASPITGTAAAVKASWEVIADTVPPAAINNLSAAPGDRLGEVKLSWTAPGDNGNEGTAAEYDIRYAKVQITDSNWSSATKVPNPPTPLPAGNQQIFAVSGLEGGATYYFAIKTRDFAGNWSGISNVVSASAAVDTTPPTTPGRPIDQGDVTDVATQLEFKWTPSTDPESDIVKYILTIYVDSPVESNKVTSVDIGPQQWTEETIGGIKYIKYTVIYNFTRGKRYFARVKARNAAGLESNYSEASDGILIREEVVPPIIAENKLYPPYPVSINPLRNEKVSIKYDVSEDAKVTIRIYNIFGELVKTLVNGEMKGGPATYQELWDGKDARGDTVGNGVYIIHIKIGSYTQSKKVLVAKE